MSYVRRNRWTARQINFLIENCYTMRDQDIADYLGKTLKSVRRRRERLEMKKALGRGKVAMAVPKTINVEPKAEENPPSIS